MTAVAGQRPLMSYVTVTSVTFDEQSNGRRTVVVAVTLGSSAFIICPTTDGYRVGFIGPVLSVCLSVFACPLSR